MKTHITLTLRTAQHQVLCAALQHWLDIKAKEIEDNTYTQRNAFDILAPSHNVMHGLNMLHELTDKPMEHFMNPLQPPPPAPPTTPATPSSPEIAPLQPSDQAGKELHPSPSSPENPPSASDLT